MTSNATLLAIGAALLAITLFACGDDSGPTDSSTGDSAVADSATGDGGVMCIALGDVCEGTVPCCAPNGCAGGMCGAPRPDAGGDAAADAGGDAGTCAELEQSCATLPCCGVAQCVMPSMICQPGPGG